MTPSPLGPHCFTVVLPDGRRLDRRQDCHQIDPRLPEIAGLVTYLLDGERVSEDEAMRLFAAAGQAVG